MVVSFAAVGIGFRNSIEFFRTPTQLVEEGVPSGTFRIGGLVKVDTVKSENETIEFVVTDHSHEYVIQFDGILPNLFEEGQGVIGRGEMVDGVFIADEILAKHDEEYMPRELVNALEEQGVYQPN